MHLENRKGAILGLSNKTYGPYAHHVHSVPTLITSAEQS